MLLLCSWRYFLLFKKCAKEPDHLDTIWMPPVGNGQPKARLVDTWHYPRQYFKPVPFDRPNTDTFMVVRNPYSKLVSLFSELAICSVAWCRT